MDSVRYTLTDRLSPDTLPSDHCKRLLRCWSDARTASGPPSLSSILADRMDWCADHLAVAVAEDNGGYRFTSSGRGIARISGTDLTGRSTQDIAGGFGRFIEAAFDIATLQDKPILVRDVDPNGATHIWSRLILPVHLTDTSITAALCLFEPDGTKQEILKSVAGDNSAWIATLDPVRETDGTVTDFTLMPLAAPRLQPDADWTTLSALLGRRPSAEDIAAILSGDATDRIIFHDEDPGQDAADEDAVRSHVRFTGKAPLASVVVTRLSDVEAGNGETGGDTLAHHALGVTRTGYWRLDTQSGTVDIAPELYAIWETTPEAHPQSRGLLHRHYPPKIRDRLDTALIKAIEDGRGFRITAPLKTASGAIVYTHVSVDCEKAADGSVLAIIGVVRDTTEEHDRLRQQSATLDDPKGTLQRLSDFVAISSDWLWETDAAHIFTYISPNASRILPMPVEEMIGTSRLDLPVIEADRPTLEEHKADLEKHAPFRNLTLRLALDDGALRHVRMSGKPIRDEDGAVIGYRGTGQDVTIERERLAAERADAARLRAALDGLGLAVADLDPTSGTLTLTPAVCAMLGINPMSSMPIDAFAAHFAAEDADAVLAATEAVRHQSGTRTLPVVRRMGDDVRYLRLHLSAPEPHDETAPPIRLLMADETDEVLARRDLELAALELEQAQTSARLGSWSHHRETGITLASATFRSLIGWDETADPPGLEDVLERFHPEDRAAIDDLLDKLMQTGGRGQDETRIVLPNRRVIDVWTEVRVDHVEDPETAHIAIVLQDVTQEKAETRERERILAAINNTRDAIVLCDGEGLALFVNGTAERLFGYDRQALNRRDGIAAVLAEPDKVGALLTPETDVDETDLSVRTEGGGERVMAVSRAPVGGNDGAVILTFHDVTGRVAERNHLIAQHKELKSAHRIAGFAAWRYDIDSDAYRWSDDMYALTGHDPETFKPSRSAVLSLMPDTDNRLLLEREAALIETGVPDSLDIRMRRPDDTYSDYTMVMELERTSNGDPVAIQGTLQDISERKAAERLLNAREQDLREAQRLGRMGSWSFRFGDDAYTWSPELYELLGYSPKTFRPTPAAMLSLHPREDRERIEDADAHALETGETYSLDISIRRADGRYAAVFMTNKCQTDADGNIVGFFGTIQDVTDRREAEAKLERLAYYDTLTGTGNRAMLRRALSRVTSRCLRMGEKAALFLVDVDRFKDVNDAMGHKVGDQLIRAVAERISDYLKPGAILARLGGDEFALLVPELQGIDDANAEVASLMKLFDAPFVINETELFTRISVGVVVLPSDTASADEIIRQADLALHRAKDEGRGRASYYDSGFDEALRDRLSLGHDLRAVLKRGGEGLESYFQPQVDLKTGRVVGFETLIRWNHPIRGFVRPDEFISIAEANGLIGDLGIWILRDSCRQAREWHDAGLGTLDIAVNVSPAQFRQVDMTAEVQRALDDTGLDPKRLTLELTESVFVDAGENTIKNLLDRFADMGLKLALDDFGTGYSSLGYLHALPFHKLKIDRTFIDGAETEPDKQALLRGILGLGRGLGMTVVAEGAENQDQARLLRGWGCDIIQGYVFGRPVPAASVPGEINRIETMASSLLGLNDQLQATG